MFSSTTSKYFLFSLLLCFTGIALANSLIPPQVKFKSILTSQIEKLSYVNSVIQDKDGFIWIAAEHGLARYDGYKIKIYRHDRKDPHSLPNNWILSLVQTRDQSLWVISYWGACKYVPEADNFDCLKLPETDPNHPPGFYSLYEHSDGKYWISSSLGLKIFDPSTNTFEPAPKVITEALPPLADSEVNYIKEIVQQADGRLWLGTYGNGVLRYDPADNQIAHFSMQTGLGSNKIQDLLVDSKGTVWIATLGAGIYQFNEVKKDFVPIKYSTTEKRQEVWSITEDAKGLIWIGDGAGVYLYDPVYNEFAAYSHEEGVQDSPGNFVTRTIYHDNDGGTWLGYFPSGLDRVDQLASQFKNFHHIPGDDNSLADGGVLATLEDELGNLWVGCGFGLSYLNRNSGKFTTYKNEKDNPNSLSGSTILDIDMDANGMLWIGSWDKGINKLDRKKMKFTRYQEDPKVPGTLFGREPWAVLVDSANRLWVGTEKGLNLYQADRDQFKKVMPKNRDGNAISNLYIREIYEDSKGLLWIGSFNGVYVLDPKREEFTQHYANNPEDKNSISSNQITSIFEDQEGSMWLGTNGVGLNKINMRSGQITRYQETDGLLSSNISGIIDDQLGNLWISSFHGLTRLNTSNGNFTNFTANDGPIGNLYNRNTPSRLKNRDLVFGSTRGLTLFDPLNLNNQGRPPIVAITDFLVFNKPVMHGEHSPLKYSIVKAKNIELRYDQSVFSFEFAALDFSSPNENRFSYRLLGFEDNWNDVGVIRHATYTNLDPGKYILQVRAANKFGVWSAQAREITIRIHPPWWDTVWAWTIYFLLAAGSIFRMVYVYRNKLIYEREKLEHERAIVKQLKDIDQLKDQINRELDTKVEERTQELRREHQELVRAQRELKLLNSRLQEMSATDLLTGLKNRRFLYQSIDADITYLARQWSKYLQTKQDKETTEGLTFILLDIDHFKKINDKYGHTAGDSVLTQLSGVLLANVRESDFVIRWGGEEFVIVLRHLPRTASFQIVERLYRSIQSYKAILNNDSIIDIRCSIGIVFYPFLSFNPNALSWEQVLNIADQALYCAKQSGRDCWVSVEPKSELKNPDLLADAIIKKELTHKDILDQMEVRSSRPTATLSWFLDPAGSKK